MKLTLLHKVVGSLIISAIVAVCFIIGIEAGFCGIVRIVFGSVFLLFLPGWWITNIAFDKKEIDEIERVALSFALSISVVPLLVFYLNLAGIPITEWLVWGVVVGIMFVCMGWGYMKKNLVDTHYHV